MKVAYVAHIRFPSERAHAVQIVHMANAFAALGHAVELYVSTRKTAIEVTPEEYYGMPFGFSLQRISILDIVGRIHSFPKILHRYLYTFERVLFGLSFVFSTKSGEHDLVYCRDDMVLWVISRFRPRQKIVWESHEGNWNYFSRRLIRRGLTVVISEGIKERYVSLGCDPARLLVAHDAVDDSFFQTLADPLAMRIRLGIITHKPIVMYIGGLDAWKGVQTLFEAAALVPQMQVVVIGGSEAELASLRARYPQVQFLGPRPYRELPQNQRAADVLVVPNTAKNTLSSSYTSPLKLFAHMTSQVPLVVADIPSLRAIVDEKSAYFFEPDNAASLAAVLSAVINAPEDAHTRSACAYELSKHHTWVSRAELILRAYSAAHSERPAKFVAQRG